MVENLPPGFRFHPTDEELITCYLTRKVSSPSFTSKVIADVDLNKCEPWDLPGKDTSYYTSYFLHSLSLRSSVAFFRLGSLYVNVLAGYLGQLWVQVCARQLIN